MVIDFLAQFFDSIFNLLLIHAFIIIAQKKPELTAQINPDAQKTKSEASPRIFPSLSAMSACETERTSYVEGSRRQSAAGLYSWLILNTK